MENDDDQQGAFLSFLLTSDVGARPLWRLDPFLGTWPSNRRRLRTEAGAAEHRQQAERLAFVSRYWLDEERAPEPTQPAAIVAQEETPPPPPPSSSPSSSPEPSPDASENSTSSAEVAFVRPARESKAIPPSPKEVEQQNRLDPWKQPQLPLIRLRARGKQPRPESGHHRPR